MKLTHTRNSILEIVGLFLLSGALCLNAVAGNDTWTGAAGDNNWNTGGNWTGPNTPPAAGDIISFGAQGAGSLTLNNNLTVDTAFAGLNFNATAPSFVLTGNEITLTGDIIDNSLNLETINLPITTTVTNNIGAVSGGTMVIGGVISGTGGGINTTLGGTVKLNNNNTYTGGTTISGGTLTLDYTGAATSIIPSTSTLTLGGGTLNVIGNSSAASSQTFASLAVSSGDNVFPAGPASGANYPTVNLGAMTETVGGVVEFIGPATTNALTARIVPATATITTTSAGGGGVGLIGGNGTTSGDYATVGLYDWATTDTAAGGAGASPYTIVGGSQVTGFYTAFGTGNNTIAGNADFTAATAGTHNTDSPNSVRFNATNGCTWSFTGLITTGGILVTPNVGAANVILPTGGDLEPSRGGASTMVVWQNNVEGFLEFNGVNYFNDARSGAGTLVLAGLGTVEINSTGAYTGPTYIDNGAVALMSGNDLGALATGATVYLEGGTICGNTNFALDNAGANIRPVVLGSNGGGLAATTTNTMTIDGVISGAGPLTIGIPASSANNNTVGLVPGTGAGTANTNAVYATGTVALTGANTYTGNTLISSGTLQLGATGSINNSTNIIVGTGATLMGSGTVNGLVTVAAGGTLAPGNPSGTLTINNNLALVGSSVLNYVLGTNTDSITVNSNLTLAGTVNITAGDGFGVGTYTLATYGSLTWGNPTLGTKPAGYGYAFNTNTAGQVNLDVLSMIITPPTATGIIYGHALSSSSLSGGSASTPGTFAFTVPGIIPNAGVTNVSVTFTPTDTTNYTRVTMTVSVTVNQALATVTLNNLSQTYDGTAKLVAIETVPPGLNVLATYNGLASAPTNAGSYTVIGTVSNANYLGGATNTLVIKPVLPFIAQQPASQSVVVGSPVTFSVTAGGTGPLGYQWQKNSTPLADGGTISGSSTTNLTVSAVSAADAGIYSVVVTNVGGSVISSNAQLTVNGKIYVVGTNVVSGGMVSVPLKLDALGEEISLQFSLNFNPVVLTFLGVDDPSVLVTTNSPLPGTVGLTFQNFAGYSPGDQLLVNVVFAASPVTSNTVSAVTFGNVPVGQEVIDSSFNVLTNMVYNGGSVTVIPAEYAADVFPYPGGDSNVDLRDWAELGRLVTGLDAATNADLMLRADCAPRGNPDGILTVADWVQAGRYAAKLDPLTIVNLGDPVPQVMSLPAAHPMGGSLTLVQMTGSTATNGQTVTVPVNLVASGSENALGYNVAFDATKLAFQGVTKGSAAGSAVMNINTNQALSGRLGITMSLSSGHTFGSGTNQLALLGFTLLNMASGNLTVNFSATNPVVQQVCNVNAGVMSASYTSAVIIDQTLAPPKPTLQIQMTNGMVNLVWPQIYSNFTLQSAGNIGSGIWNSNLSAPSIQGSNLFITMPATNAAQFFRLSQ